MSTDFVMFTNIYFFQKNYFSQTKAPGSVIRALLFEIFQD